MRDTYRNAVGAAPKDGFRSGLRNPSQTTWVSPRRPPKQFKSIFQTRQYEPPSVVTLSKRKVCEASQTATLKMFLESLFEIIYCALDIL
jgi:hypothetical protein